MRIHAFPETYLYNAMTRLGEAFDFAIAKNGMKGSDFVALFLGSDVAPSFECGNPAIIAGRSGIEIAYDLVLEKMGRELEVGRAHV